MFSNGKKIKSLIIIVLLYPILIFSQGETKKKYDKNNNDSYDNYKEIKDSIDMAEVDEIVKTFQELYEISKKHQKLKQLLKDKEKNDLIIRNQRIFIGLTSFVLMLLLTIFFYIHFQNNTLKKKCNEIRKQNKEIAERCHEANKNDKIKNIKPQNFESRFDGLKPLNLKPLDPELKPQIRIYKIKVRNSNEKKSV